MPFSTHAVQKDVNSPQIKSNIINDIVNNLTNAIGHLKLLDKQINGGYRCQAPPHRAKEQDDIESFTTPK